MHIREKTLGKGTKAEEKDDRGFEKRLQRTADHGSAFVSTGWLWTIDDSNLVLAVVDIEEQWRLINDTLLICMNAKEHQ